MRILMVVRNLDFGGVERRAASLACGYARSGHEVLVTCLRDEGIWAQEVRACGAGLQVIERTHGADPRGLLSLARIVGSFDPDVIDAHQTRPNILTPLALDLNAGFGRLGRTARRAGRRRAPYVASSYLLDNWRSPAIRIAERSSLRRAARVVTDSGRLAQDLRERARLAESSVVVIPNGVADARTARSARAEVEALVGGSGPLVVHVGRLLPYKGQRAFLRAAARVVESGLAARFLVVGDGDESYTAELRGLAAAEPLAGRAAVTAWEGEIGSILQVADVFVLASTKESLPISILEAMSAGLPVIATDVGGVAEAVTDDVNGYLLPTTSNGPDIGALAGALTRVIADPALRRRLGDVGRQRFEVDYSVSTMVERALEVVTAAAR